MPSSRTGILWAQEQEEWLLYIGETLSRGPGEGLLDIVNSYSCSPFQDNCLVSGPLVASSRDLGINLNPGIQFLDNPMMARK